MQDGRCNCENGACSHPGGACERPSGRARVDYLGHVCDACAMGYYATRSRGDHLPVCDCFLCQPKNRRERRARAQALEAR